MEICYDFTKDHIFSIGPSVNSITNAAPREEPNNAELHKSTNFSIFFSNSRGTDLKS
jgi:hypothetical protein